MAAALIVDVQSSPDADLLAAAALGDEPALGTLVERYINLVYGVAVRRTGNAHLAEDVTQAVFLVLRKRAASVRSSGLPAWLHQTTRHVAANAIRAERRRTRRERAAARPEAMMDMEIEEPNSFALLLDDAIASLGAKDRSVIIERYLQARDLDSIAVSLGSSPGAVQKRIERSLRKLRSYFARRQREIDLAAMAAIVAVPLSITANVKAAVIDPGVASATSLTLCKGILFMRSLKITSVSFAVVLLGAAMAVYVERFAATNVDASTATPLVTPATNPSVSAGPFEKLAPFTDIKWDGESAQIFINGKWFNWVSLDGRSLADLIQDARGVDDRLWQKRIDEDLVEVLARTGHPAGPTVKLVVSPIDNPGQLQTLDNVPMTHENRQSVHAHRVERGQT